MRNGEIFEDVKTTNQYTISGLAWIDENRDGARDTSEEVLGELEVVALNADTNVIESTSSTSSDGKYYFILPEGSYIILFYYDNNLYTTTTYQAEGVSSTENSDAIEMEITQESNEQTVGMTDILELNKNLINIDIGLILRSTFDLTISKYVNKMTVTNDSETTTYEQKDNTKLAKAEIKSKYLEGSLVVIEYKIEITNNGDIAGYAKNIVDYMPETLSFNSSLNTDWYISGNNLYNTSLANTKIEPGETKELTLVLTKTMTQSNTGLINNKAEIIESSNDLGITDETNDKGSADVIINVSTGELVNYIITLVLSIIILVSLWYFIKKIPYKRGEMNDKT